MAEKVEPVVMGGVGLGGYAGSCSITLEQWSKHAEGNVRLHAVAEPDLETHAERVAQLRASGVKVFRRYEELLAEPIEAVWVPLPIHLHRSFTEKALAAGKAVLCEKPVAGCIDDVDAMIAARDRAKLPVLIGYQHNYDPTALAVKRALLAGEIGKVRRASVWACWPRGDNYYARNNWAGKLRVGETWVLDSPANNALAHQVNLMLFLLGDSDWVTATPQRIEAELYRANPIENHDTISLRITIASGATILVLLTHACQHTRHPAIAIEGDAGAVRFDTESIIIQGKQGQRPLHRDTDMRFNMVRRFAEVVRGQPNDTIAACTLDMARNQCVALSAASQAAAVVDVPESDIRVLRQNEATHRCIADIEETFAACAEDWQMLHESHRATWTQPGGSLDTRNYRHFTGPAVLAEKR